MKNNIIIQWFKKLFKSKPNYIGDTKISRGLTKDRPLEKDRPKKPVYVTYLNDQYMMIQFNNISLWNSKFYK